MTNDTRLTKEQKAAVLHFMEINFPTAPDRIYEKFDKAFRVTRPDEGKPDDARNQVAYWAGRLLGHDQAWEVAQEIIDFKNEGAEPVSEQEKFFEDHFSPFIRYGYDTALLDLQEWAMDYFKENLDICGPLVDKISKLQDAKKQVDFDKLQITFTSSEYDKLIADEYEEVVRFAAAHGWKSSRYERGRELRALLNSDKKVTE